MSSHVGSYGSKSNLIELSVEEKNKLIPGLTKSFTKYAIAEYELHKLTDALEKKDSYEKFVDAVYKQNQLEMSIKSREENIVKLMQDKENLAKTEKKLEVLAINAKKKIEQGLIKQGEGRQLKEEGRQLKEEGRQLKEEGRQLREEGCQLKEEGRQLREEGCQLKEEGRQLKEEGRQLREEAQETLAVSLGNAFLGTFGYKLDGKYTLETIQTKYVLPSGIPDGLYLDKEKNCYRLTSFGPFIKFFNDTPEKKACNFKKYGDIGANVDEFVLYVLNSRVNSIVFHKAMETRKILQNTEVRSKVIGNLTIKEIFEKKNLPVKTELTLVDLKLLAEVFAKKKILLEFRE